MALIELVPPQPVALSAVGESDYAVLKKRVQAAGLLRKRPGYYAIVISANAALVALGVAVLVLVHNPWLRVLDAAFLGLVSGQLGFQLHDAGHRQMFNRGWMNVAVGLFTADALLGSSYSWWVSKHNLHHANPNDIDEDPDISSGALVYTREEALQRRGAMRTLTAYQAFLFFPMLFLMGFSMHVSSAGYLVRNRATHRRLEVAALLLHALVYVGGLVLLLGPWLGLIVLVVHQAVGSFYLASVFAPNHKGMPQTAGSRLDFLRAQVLTSRNVRAGAGTDFLYGALNYQIEHHLFPSMPRANMRKAQVIIRAYCAEIGVTYYETSIAQSYREILGFLHEIGQPLRPRTKSEQSAG
ncbi:MAG TPA: acyl-CoA desaturase [Candidatus Dormibacteraeota bacterium]|nr:acyl-CoA desaturase [Candidatus Dormibacteraeota bacterium]